MPDCTIERLTERTFPDFLFLLERLAEYEHLDPPDEEGRVRLAADAFGDSPRFEGYLCRFNGQPVGYVTFYFTYSTFLARPTLFLEDLFVLEHYRGRGLGGRLFEFCRSEARNRGCGRMDWMVLTWNEPSIRFYEKIGASRLDWYTYRLDREKL
ncbi:GNAT superfamily N-acetyltransferase [Methanolinea mesophila]|uniref:GNAT family N-acetyltransferase n=1 Tax=Methanolinea mesophila TaxID=547055 RepID=UPI001AE23DE1|nr:GNAT family N-acetyltransferase [Methanolinea mesophila]MBP1929941.1 GNAT superfamily N-acetyltransferase [Methanolinea mesophila]